MLLRNSIFFVIFQVGGGGSGPLVPPGTGPCLHLLRYTENPFYRAHRLLYDTWRTFYRSTSRERCMFFFNFVIFFNSENSSTYFKALGLAITARAGHFTDSVRKKLAAIENKNEKIAQNHIAVFSTRFYHIFTCIYIPFLLMVKSTF